MKKSSFEKLLKANGFDKVITYNYRKEKVTIYLSEGMICELATGLIFAHSVLFTKKDGQLIAFHNLKSGYRFYTESIKKEIGL